MSTITLTKTETALLIEAKGRGGLVVLPETMKPASAQRLLGKLTRDKLAAAGEQEGETSDHLAPSCYRAVGLRRPGRRSRIGSMVISSHSMRPKCL